MPPESVRGALGAESPLQAPGRGWAGWGWGEGLRGWLEREGSLGWSWAEWGQEGEAAAQVWEGAGSLLHFWGQQVFHPGPQSWVVEWWAVRIRWEEGKAVN